MVIRRDGYLQQLLAYRFDGQVKVISGIRRSGKSFLLNKLYKDYLLAEGVPEQNIIQISLDLTKDLPYRDPLVLARSVRERVMGLSGRSYLFIDEIQMADKVANPYNPQGSQVTFYDALNDLRTLFNLDIYVTGSNSKMLSSDILTEFRGRSDEIRMHPLSFREYYAVAGLEKEEALEQYAFYGGLPFILSRPDDLAKMEYLKNLVKEVYLKDIVERKHVQRQDILEQVLDLLCSSVGSLTNPTKINGLLQTQAATKVSANTVASYIGYLEDAFLFSSGRRFDVKGKKYFEYPYKYYCEDLGLRNARIGFRQMEMTHLMENMIYNDLRVRGFGVDVGVVYTRELIDGKDVRRPCEIDFVATLGHKKYYLQSAFALPDPEKVNQEVRPLALIGDSFPKIIIRKDIRKRWYDERGILNIGLIDFLLDESVL